MKRITILLLVLFTATTFAQQTDTVKNSLVKGKLALMFAVNANFTTGALDGGTVSLKYNLSKKLALRIGLTVNTSNANRTSINYTTYETASGGADEQAYNTTCYLVYYPNPKDKANLYVGIGGIYQWSKYEETLYDGVHFYVSRWIVGPAVLIGVEVFPTKFIGLFGEYYPYFYIGKEYSNQIRRGEFTHSEADIKGIVGSKVRLGLALYFDWPF